MNGTEMTPDCDLQPALSAANGSSVSAVVFRVLRSLILAPVRQGRIRRALVAQVHVVLWIGSFLLALGLRFEGSVPHEYVVGLLPALAMLLCFRAAAFYIFGLFHGLWRYAGVSELRRLILATSLGTLAYVAGAELCFRVARMPRSVYIGEWLTAIVFLGGTRLFTRIAWERGFGNQRASLPTLIVGAGDAGESLLRDLQRLRENRWSVVGFVDDSPAKQRAIIHGVRVLGRADESTLTRVIKEFEVKLVILAIPTAQGERIREIIGVCRSLEVETKTTPTVSERIDGLFKMSALREVNITDLLRRSPVSLNTEQIARFIRGKTILLTGAGGSIGSELARQCLRFQPKTLILFEHDENALFYVERELAEISPDTPIRAIIGDISDVRRVESTFREYRPEVVLHAAAHKHVPMMETNPCEAVKNNVFGSLVIARTASTYGAEAFVLISTDKAVKPTSVMGTTKRIAEMAIQVFARDSSTRFIAVRFGNVLGSAGSVVPLFQTQIAQGGPVTVTHPEMCRYFMTIPEATQLVLQAGAFGGTGEIFLLDMGQPVRIVDLARDLIELSGLRPDVDIKIEFSGLRPGEKLVEELLGIGEACDATPHPKILTGRIHPPPPDVFQRKLDELRLAAMMNDESIVREMLADIVPEASIAHPQDPDAVRFTVRDDQPGTGPISVAKTPARRRPSAA